MPNALVFVDASIFVYAHDDRDGVKQQVSRQWIDRLWVQQLGRTSAQVLNEFYTAVTRPPMPLLTQEQAWRNVQILMGWKPLSVDAGLLLEARQVQDRYRISWWDALVVAAARLQGCPTLLTEDLQHGALLSGVRVVNPFVLEVHEEPVKYRVEPAPRHRPRGRPRKQPAVA